MQKKENFPSWGILNVKWIAFMYVQMKILISSVVRYPLKVPSQLEPTRMLVLMFVKYTNYYSRDKHSSVFDGMIEWRRIRRFQWENDERL